jgi:hypothetical protein
MVLILIIYFLLPCYQNKAISPLQEGEIPNLQPIAFSNIEDIIRLIAKTQSAIVSLLNSTSKLTSIDDVL